MFMFCLVIFFICTITFEDISIETPFMSWNNVFLMFIGIIILIGVIFIFYKITLKLSLNKLFLMTEFYFLVIVVIWIFMMHMVLLVFTVLY